MKLRLYSNEPVTKLEASQWNASEQAERHALLMKIKETEKRVKIQEETNKVMAVRVKEMSM